MCEFKPSTFKELIESCKGNYTTAFINEDDSISYNDFYEDCVNSIDFIYHCTDKQNIALFHDSSYEWIVFYYAIQLAGKTAVVIDANKSIGVLEKICKDFDIDVILTNRKLDTRIKILGHQKYTKKCSEWVMAKNAYISTVIFTSGTSENNPKGVALSEKGLLIDSYYGSIGTNINSNDQLLHIMPFSHAFGLVGEVILPIIAKSTVCFGRGLGNIVKDIKKYSVTSLYVVPQILRGLLVYLNKNELKSVKKFTCGSAEPEPDVINEYIKSGKEVHVTYGMTECSPCVAISSPLTHMKKHYAGKSFPCCDIKVSPSGEILVSGDNLMLGYYDGTTIDKSSIEDGYLHTGDIGYLNGDDLYVIGRTKNILVFDNGEKMVKSELEDRIKMFLDAKECFTFIENNALNIVLTDFTSEVSLKELYSIIPVGIKLGKIYKRTKPLARTSLGKLVNSSQVQISEAIDIKI